MGCATCPPLSAPHRPPAWASLPLLASVSRGPWLSAPSAHFAHRPPACVSADRERPLVPGRGGGARGEHWTGGSSSTHCFTDEDTPRLSLLRECHLARRRLALSNPLTGHSLTSWLHAGLGCGLSPWRTSGAQAWLDTVSCAMCQGSSLRRTCLSRTLNSVDIVTAGTGLGGEGTLRLGLDGKGRVLGAQGGWGSRGVGPDPLSCRARCPQSASLRAGDVWEGGCAGPLNGPPPVPTWKVSGATEGTSLSVGKGPWNWGVLREMEDNGAVRGTVGLLVWAEWPMLALPE